MSIPVESRQGSGDAPLRQHETERETQSADETFLSEAGRLLSTSLDYETTLDRITALVVPAFADWCMLDLLAGAGTFFDRVAVGHHLPGGADVARALRRRYPLRPDLPYGVARAVQELRPQLVRDCPDDLLRAVAHDEEHLAAARSLMCRSFVTAPLVSRGRAIGALTLIARDRNFDDRDAWIAEGLAWRAASAIDNARLFAAESRARVRITRMQEVTAALSRASTAEEVAEVACRIGSEAMEARSGALWLVQNDGSLRLAGSWGTPPTFMDQFRVIATDEQGAPAIEVVRRRRPIWVETEDDYREVAPAIFEKAKAAGRVASYGAVPLYLEKRCAGVAVFAHDVGHHYDADERSFYIALAEHCSQALDRARLLDAERRSNERLRLLADAGEVLGASFDIEETLRALTRTMVPAFADWAGVYLLEGDDLRAVGVEHADPAKVALAMDYLRRYPSKLTDRTGVGAVLSSGKTQWFANITDEVLRSRTRDAEHFEILRALGPRSSIRVPVFAGRKPVAVVSFVTAESGRRYEKSDCGFAEEIARRAGAAIERARLHRAAEQAAHRAEVANRLKDEFLATVSHELRTPLTAIGGWAEVIARKVDDPVAVAKGLEVIRRNVHAQAKLVEDILDVSRIITGKLRIEPTPIDMTAIARDALEIVRPSLDAKQLALVFEAPDAPCLLVGDGQRLQQVTWNLLSNAIKFSEAGGRITLRVEKHGPSVAVTVSDTGHGIDPDFLPYVFERFKQADSSTTRKFGGLGLGLAIVRHIVELHGGRVSVESDGAGMGATFRVVLPVRVVAPPSLVDATTEASLFEQRPETRANIAGARILVLDDEPDARTLLEAVLTDAQASVETRATVRDALTAFDVFRPHVVVCDIGLPDEDGYAFIGKLRARPGRSGAAIPVIALTAYARPEDRRRAVTAGFNAHVPKPVDADELIAVISNLYRMAKV